VQVYVPPVVASATASTLRDWLSFWQWNGTLLDFTGKRGGGNGSA